MMAPVNELRMGAKLPKLAEIASKVHADQEEVSTDLSKYNDNAGRKLTFDDALWGRAVANSRAMDFGQCAPLALVPIADMMNNSELAPNVQSHIDCSSNMMMWKAL